MKSVAVIALVCVSGCFFDEEEPLPPLEGDVYRYVVSDLRIPASNAEAREFGIDLNDDTVVDNQLGMVLATLENIGLGIADTASEALQRGGLLMLAELQTTSLDDAGDAGLITYLGGDSVPDACTDDENILTCGQHLKGTGQFTIEPGSASHQARGPIVDGLFIEGTGIMPIEFAISVAGVIRLDLRGAYVKLTDITADGARGVLAGAIAPIDIDGVVVPEAAQQADRIIGSECSGQPTPSSPCGCTGRGETLQKLFDKNNNCRVEVREVATNSIVQSLLSPDVRVHDQQMLSFGVGVEFARATF